jgi:hypothetical protein
MKWLQETNVKLWQMMLGFVLSTFIAAGISVPVNQWIADHQLASNQKLAEVNDFLKASQEFESLTRIYVTKLTDKNAPDKSAREALISNIQRQYFLSKIAQSSLPENDKAEAVAYQRELTQLIRYINATTDVPTATGFVQSLNDTLVQRNRLISVMRNSAGLPSESTSSSTTENT